MGNQDFTPANTGTTLYAQDAASMRKLWHKGALIGEEEEDFFQQMEGASQRSLIWTQNDTSKGNGQTMTFTTRAGFYGRGKRGEELFEGPSDYEQHRISSFDLKVDYVRNAVSRSDRAEELMGLRNELASQENVELGRWLGRLKTQQIMGLCTLTLPDENRLYAGGKTLHALGSADVLSWDDIVTVGQAMKPMGGKPADVSGPSASPIWSQTFVPSETAALSLKLDSDYKLVLQNGDVRGRGNTIFKGGYPSIDGHTIVPHNAINHAGVGPVGSFLAPEAFLGLAITGTTDAARDISGGGADNSDGSLTGSGKPLWFQNFPGYAYEFVDTGAFSPSSGPHYAIIYNTTGANAGKWGFVKYTTGNNGNKITITEFLTGQSNGTYRKGTIGSVTWSGAVNTEEWASGALIIPANSKGVPIGHTIAMGAAGILRGYGKYRANRTTDTQNGGFVKQSYITSVFGQSLRKDRKGRVPAVMLLTHAISKPGIALPTVS